MDWWGRAERKKARRVSGGPKGGPCRVSSAAFLTRPVCLCVCVFGLDCSDADTYACIRAFVLTDLGPGGGTQRKKETR